MSTIRRGIKTKGSRGRSEDFVVRRRDELHAYEIILHLILSCNPFVNVLEILDDYREEIDMTTS